MIETCCHCGEAIVLNEYTGCFRDVTGATECADGTGHDPDQDLSS